MRLLWLELASVSSLVSCAWETTPISRSSSRYLCTTNNSLLMLYIVSVAKQLPVPLESRKSASLASSMAHYFLLNYRFLKAPPLRLSLRVTTLQSPSQCICRHTHTLLTFVSSATLHTNEVWECSGSLALTRGEFGEETYVSVAQNLILFNPPTPLIAQIASYQAEHPIVYIQTSGRPIKLVWSSPRARRTYHFATHGMPGSPIALVGHLPLQSHVTMLFVDISGAVNVARLPAMSADGNQPPKCLPIPLDSMKNAFSWAIKDVPAPAEGGLGLDLRPRIVGPRPPQHPLSGHLGSWSNRVESRISQSGIHSTAEIVQTGFKSTHDIAQTGFHSIQNMVQTRFQPTTDVIRTGLQQTKPIREVVQTGLQPMRAPWKWGRGLWSRSGSDEGRSESIRASGGDVGENEGEWTCGSDNETQGGQQKMYRTKTEHQSTTVYQTKTEHASTAEHKTSTKYWTEAGYGPKLGLARVPEYDQRPGCGSEPGLPEVISHSPTLPYDRLKPYYEVEEVESPGTRKAICMSAGSEVICALGPQMSQLSLPERTYILRDLHE